MNAALILIAAVLAVLAAVVGGKGALLARPMAADLERNFQNLTTIVDETLSGTALFLKTLRSTLGRPETKWPDKLSWRWKTLRECRRLKRNACKRSKCETRRSTNWTRSLHERRFNLERCWQH